MKAILGRRTNIANPRRSILAVEERKRLDKLEAVAERLKRGEKVQNRQLKIWLNDVKSSQIEVEWQEQWNYVKNLKTNQVNLNATRKAEASNLLLQSRRRL